jgi:hypothetical protein
MIPLLAQEIVPTVPPKAMEPSTTWQEIPSVKAILRKLFSAGVALHYIT